MHCKKCGHSVTRVVNGQYQGEEKHRWRRCVKCDALVRTVESYAGVPGPKRGTPIWWTPVRGNKHPNAVFTEDDIRNMRKLSATGTPYSAIAKTYGTSPSYVSRIVRRLAWTHVS